LLRRDRIDDGSMSVWDTEFISLAEQINEYRERYLLELIPKIRWVIEELSTLKGFEFKYYEGWDTSKMLKDILLADRQ
jgi:recombinational DNA repair ATPase RecF